MTQSERSAITILILLASFAGFFFYQDNKINNELEEQAQLEIQQIAEVKNKIESLDLEAKAISVYDIDTKKELYGKNEREILPLASLAKIMTALIAFQLHPSDNQLKISSTAIGQEGDNSLFSNEVWDLEELIKLTLISSSNDGAWALAENVENFLPVMNEKAKKLGLESIKFFNSTGLDFDNVGAGAVGNAFDVNQMAIFALKIHPDIFSATTALEATFKSESGFIHKVKNTNISIKRIPNPLFSKTGYSLLAGGNLTIIFKAQNEHLIAITILGSSLYGRFSDMEKLVNIL